MIKRFIEGCGTLGGAKRIAESLLKNKKEGTKVQLTFYNGFANFVKKNGKLEIAG